MIWSPEIGQKVFADIVVILDDFLSFVSLVSEHVFACFDVRRLYVVPQSREHLGPMLKGFITQLDVISDSYTYDKD